MMIDPRLFSTYENKKEKNMINILLLDGYTRQVLPMAKALRNKGYFVTVLCRSKFDLGYCSRWPHKKIIGPDPEEKPNNYKIFLFDLLSNNNYGLVIPLFDYSAEILSKNKKDVENYTKVAVNNWEIFSLSRNKLNTMKKCLEYHIPHPKTIISESNEFELAKKLLSFPVIIKPCIGQRSEGFFIIQDFNHLERKYKIIKKEFGSALIQEYLPQEGKSFLAELFISHDGDLLAAVVSSKNRWYPLKGGTNTLYITIERPDIINTCYRLLRSIGWIGYADIELIEDYKDGIAKIIEINPRISAGIKVSFEAGVDFANIITSYYLNCKKISFINYKKGIHLRHFHKDLLWFIKSPNRFRSNPSWFSFRKNKDLIIDRHDLYPSIVYTFCSIKEYITIKSNKSESYNDLP